MERLLNNEFIIESTDHILFIIDHRNNCCSSMKFSYLNQKMKVFLYKLLQRIMLLLSSWYETDKYCIGVCKKVINRFTHAMVFKNSSMVFSDIVCYCDICVKKSCSISFWQIKSYDILLVYKVPYVLFFIENIEEVFLQRKLK